MSETTIQLLIVILFFGLLWILYINILKHLDFSPLFTAIKKTIIFIFISLILFYGFEYVIESEFIRNLLKEKGIIP